MGEKLFYKINLCLSKNEFSFKSVGVHFTKTRLLGLFCLSNLKIRDTGEITTLQWTLLHSNDGNQFKV